MVWRAAVGAGLVWSTWVWVAQMRVLKKLSERHRQAARLLVRGKKFVEIAEELGGHPYYWGQIAKTPLMRGEIEHCRQQVDNAWLRAEEARQLEILGVPSERPADRFRLLIGPGRVPEREPVARETPPSCPGRARGRQPRFSGESPHRPRERLRTEHPG